MVRVLGNHSDMMTLWCTVVVILNVFLLDTAKAEQALSKDPSSQLSPTISSRIRSSAFISAFLRAINQSPVVRNALTKAFSKPVTQDIFYDDMLDTMFRIGLPKPTDRAKDIINSIQTVVDVLSPQTFAFAVGACFELYLTNERVLTSDNAANVAQKYVDVLQNALYSRKASFVKTFADATIQFLKTMIKFTPNKAHVFAIDFSIALYSLKEGVQNPKPKSFKVSPVISLENNNTSPFAVTFSRALRHSRTLKTVFSSPLKITWSKELYMNNIINALSEAGLQIPRPIATALNGAIRPVLSTMTPPALAYVVVTTMDNFLKDQGLLTSDNAERLSMRFVKILEHTAYSIGQPQKPESYLNVIVQAYMKYLADLNLMNIDLAQILVEYYVRMLCKIKEEE